MRRIRAAIPDARLIVVLRDPVERAHSNWTHLWSAGLEPIGDLVRACAEEERRIKAGWAPFWHYRGLGRYGEQLEHLFPCSPASRCSSSATASWSTGPPRPWTGSSASSAWSRASSPRSPGRT